MKKRGGVEAYLHAFLTSVLDEGKWPAARPVRIPPEEGAPDRHCIAG
jgi:hypothetical protein